MWEYLAKDGLIDPNRVGITRHSAGGYATIRTLYKYPDVWSAGIVEPGISDVQAMFNETHKLEPQYLQPLCFETDTSLEEAKRIIEERSPTHWTQNIKALILILSGEVDEIVPPNQAHLMVERIQKGAVQ
jgi:dipeptidyl aminopeptidase/acylaminoacyl peptidase